MNKLFALLAAMVVCCLAPVAHAQSADPGPPSPRQVELAHQVLVVTGMRQTYEKMFQMMVDQFAASANTGSSAESTRVAAALKGAMDDVVKKMVPRMMDISADLYARNFSEQELTDLLTFYNSPSGKSMLAKTPLIMQQAQAAIFPMIPDMQHEMAEDFCDRLSCTPPMRSALMARMPGAHSGK
ncbi:MAG: DUF2059 domain-containing protein [Caulobacteraceae bacterium]|nr:DUF2059 domain-containing protein [Caulobacteraceae bacterium]